MSKKELIVNEILQMPEPFLDEVSDFLKFLKTRLSKERMEASITSESTLQKEWLSQEEDKAWQDL